MDVRDVLLDAFTHLGGADEGELVRVVDKNWDPPVTAAARGQRGR